MTDLEIVKLFEDTNPETIEDVENLGLSPKFLGEGISRKAYQLTQTLVVKIPICGGAYQSIKEIEFIEKFFSMLDKGSATDIAPHMPSLYYGNKHTGVILTKLVPNRVQIEQIEHSKEHERLRVVFASYDIGDMHFNNFRVTETGQLIAIDLGSGDRYRPNFSKS